MKTFGLGLPWTSLKLPTLAKSILLFLSGTPFFFCQWYRLWFNGRTPNKAHDLWLELLYIRSTYRLHRTHIVRLHRWEISRRSIHVSNSSKPSHHLVEPMKLNVSETLVPWLQLVILEESVAWEGWGNCGTSVLSILVVHKDPGCWRSLLIKKDICLLYNLRTWCQFDTGIRYFGKRLAS